MVNRRKTIKTILAGSSVGLTYKSLPGSWGTPIVKAVILPAHAENSPIETTAAPTTTPSCYNSQTIDLSAATLTPEMAPSNIVSAVSISDYQLFWSGGSISVPSPTDSDIDAAGGQCSGGCYSGSHAIINLAASLCDDDFEVVITANAMAQNVGPGDGLGFSGRFAIRKNQGAIAYQDMQNVSVNQSVPLSASATVLASEIISGIVDINIGVEVYQGTGLTGSRKGWMLSGFSYTMNIA